MHQKRSVKLLPRNCLFAIMILTSTVIGQTACSDSNSNNYNSEPYASNQRKMPSSGSGSGETKFEKRSSFAVISQAMSETINSEFGSAASGGEACDADGIDCPTYTDQVGLEAIRSLHRQLDDDDNGDIDLSESDDFLREELKYEGGYEKRHRAFHFNDDMHISVKELWEAWLKSEVHNWTLDQTCEWLEWSVQLPQYVNLFKKHKINGRVLPRLAVNNLHFVSNVLGIKDPIHKQKIALKAMDAVLFGPPRETGTRWKDFVLVTLLLTAIIGSWFAYQQNKRMSRDMDQLHKAEKELSKMQTDLERAREEQENVGKEKMDLERRLNEAPAMKNSSSEVELQQLKQEIELLRNELSRAEVELIDHHWTPPQGLQHWMQLTYELETRGHQKKRVAAEAQLISAREACEKLRKKRSSFVGAFVSTHGKSIDDVDRTIVEARNSLSEVTNELQERLHRWKQIETLIGCNIVNNNGIAFLENMLYRSNGTSNKTSRGRISSSQDDLDDDSIQGFLTDVNKYLRERDDSSGSEDDPVRESVSFIVGGSCDEFSTMNVPSIQMSSIPSSNPLVPLTMTGTSNTSRNTLTYPPQLVHQGNSIESNSNSNEETRSNVSSSSLQDRILPPAPPRAKKQVSLPLGSTQNALLSNRAPMPPPRRTPNSTQNPTILTSSQSVGGIMDALGALTPFPSATAVTVIHSGSKLHPAVQQQYQQCEDNLSTDSSSISDESKKRKRRFFPFSGKKSGKAKVKSS